MAFTIFDGRRLAGLALMGGILALAGCQSGDVANALNISGGSSTSQPAAATDEITVQELQGYCPAVTLRDTDIAYDSYARGGANDPTKLAFRASLTDTTRACRYDGTTMGMTVALAGRVVPGPAGSVGAVRLPVKITIMRDAEVIYSQNYNHEVMLADTIGATQFILTDANISIPLPSARNIRVFAGFETPSKK